MPPPPTLEPRLQDLLSLAQREVVAGRTPDLNELCRDCPELRLELEKALDAVGRMEEAARGLEETTAPGSAFDPQRTPAFAPATASADFVASGSRLPSVPGFEIERELGRGGMGVVYLARQQRLGRAVALKMILHADFAGPEAFARFRDEAKIVAELRHPHIVQVHEAGEFGGRPYFALEYLEGGALNQKLRERPLSAKEAATLVEKLARGMHHAHTHEPEGVLHRDLKPHNVLLDAAGEPKITDFGLAKRGDSGRTEEGAALGTPGYMAPEQADGAKHVGPAADVYALGAILYECLAGRPPFRGANVLDVLEQVRKKEPTPVRLLQPETPRDLDTICMKCLRKDPAKRYGSAAALADDLRRFLEDRPIAARPVGRAEQAWRWCRRNPTVAGLTTGLLLALVGGLAATTALYLRAEERRRAAEAARVRTRDALDAMTSAQTGDSLAQQAETTPEQKRFLEEALKYYLEFAQEEASDPAAQVRVAAAATRIGLIQARLGRKTQALAAYDRALALLRPLAAAAPDDGKLRCDLARVACNRGMYLRDLGRRAEALEACREAAALLDGGAAADSTQLRFIAHLNCGALLSETGQQAEALAAYAGAARALESARAEAGQPWLLQGQFRVANNRSLILEGMGDQAGALACCGQAVAAAKRLADEHPAEPEYRQELAAALNNRSLLLSRMGKPEEALADSRESALLLERLAESSRSTPAYRQELARAWINRGAFLRDMGRRPEAIDACARAATLLERLHGEAPEIAAYGVELARAVANRALFLGESGDLPGALKGHERALALRKEAVAATPNVPGLKSELAASHSNRGAALNALGRRPEALEAFREAIETLEGMAAEEAGKPKSQIDLANNYINRGVVLGQLGRPKEAAAAFGKAVALLEGVNGSSAASFESLQALAHAHTTKGGAEFAAGDKVAALESFRLSAAGYERLVAAAPKSPQARVGRGWACHNLGIMVGEDKPAEALAWFSQAIASVAGVEAPEAKRLLLNAHRGRAEALDELKRFQEAAPDWARVVELAPPPQQASFRVRHATALAHGGAFAEAEAEAERALGFAGLDPGSLYWVAAVLSLASGAPGRPQAQLADRAIAVLRKAVAKGFDDPEHLDRNPAFVPLRDRGDFKALAAEVTKRKRGAIPPNPSP